MIQYKGKEKKTNPRTYSINKGKSSLTSLVACFILGKVYCRTYRRGYADDIGSVFILVSLNVTELDANQRIKMLQIALQYTLPRMKQATNEVSVDLPLFIE